MNVVRYRRWPQAALAADFAPLSARAAFAAASAAANAEQWQPRVDIREEPEAFVLQADLPGIDPAQIQVQMDRNVLSIKGERKAAELAEGHKRLLAERREGSFERRFALPDSADAEGITAQGRHGVLEIRIPKKAEVAPRRIVVGNGETA
ncbi:MAG TPA: Hsp20/alpha crystallin family protein [Stenotrophomonas sp.]|nr:Hsp20/alpha crystallin family protein [Stenotrophomonas sp.]